jgi:hypothetical protein
LRFEVLYRSIFWRRGLLNMAKKIHRMVSSLGFITLAVTLPCGSAEAAISCDTSDFVGTYAFYTTGYFLQLPAPATSLTGRFAQAGTLTTNGLGYATIESTASYDGLVQRFNTTATYTLNPDCTLSFSLTLPQPLSQPAILQAVLSQNNGQMTTMITSPPGSTILGTHIKQYLSFCESSDLSGAYVIDLEGAGPAVGSNPAGPFRRAGRLIADGIGNFTANTLANYSGQLTREIFNGTYALDGSCTLTLNYTYGDGNAAQKITLSGSIAGSGYDAMIMITTSGWTVSGTLKAVQQ